MNALIASLIVLPLAATPVAFEQAQTYSHVAIQVTANRLSASGGERGSVFFQVRPIVIGQTAKWVISKRPGPCGFGVAPGAAYEAGAVMGWQIDVTPVEVDGDAVRFRVDWAREVRRGKSLQSQQADVVLTLKPRQSMPLDIVRLQPDDSSPSCDMIGGSLVATVVHVPDSNYDRRLIATDLWLVDRSSDGRERIQQLTLRGRFDEPQQFYFEDLTDADLRLDIFGELVARPKSGHIEIELTTRRRFTNPAGGVQRPAEIRSIVHVKPDDVAAIELPALTDKATGAFGNRAVSLRVRSRQIRGDRAAAQTASITARRDEPQIHVVGEVRRPGTYALTGAVTVEQAVGAAGGYTDGAAGSRMYVLRRDTKGTEQKISVGKSDAILAGDTLVVPRRRW